MEYSIGIDIGGTKILAALVDDSGRIQHQIVVPTPTEGQEQVVTTVRSLIDTLAHQMPDDRDTLIGVGIGTAGQVNFEQGRVVSGTRNIRDWNDVPLRDQLRASIDLPVYVDNDVNVIALSETRFGAAKGHRDVVFLACGTGVGGSVVSDGQLIRGSWGAAAELGHVSIHFNGPECNCGMRGCLETFASGPGIVNRLKDVWFEQGSVDTDLYRRYQSGPATFTSGDVFRAYRVGDEDATRVVDQMISALSIAIVGFIHIFNPTLVVLGGGVLSDGAWIRDAIAERIRTVGMTSLVGSVDIHIATLGPESGVVGAASQSFLYRTKQG